MTPVTLLAHQGGWDEILFVVGPILLIVGLLRLAKHRVTRPSTPSRGDELQPGEHDDRDGPRTAS